MLLGDRSSSGTFDNLTLIKRLPPDNLVGLLGYFHQLEPVAFDNIQAVPVAQTSSH